MPLEIEEFSYRYADAVLNHKKFKKSYEQLKDVLRNTPVFLINKGAKIRHRGKGEGIYFACPVDQKKINKYIHDQFKEIEGWERQQLIVEKGTKLPLTNLKGDFQKGRLHVEVQFGNMARWYADVFKFQLSYALDKIDVAVLVVPMIGFAKTCSY